MRKITFLLLLATLSMLVNAQTSRYIKVDATGTGDGTSWADAAGTADIQAIIDEVAAATNQGTVYFASGTYLIPAQIQLKNNVQLMGGYSADGSGTRDLLLNQTILDGQFNKRILFTGDAVPTVAFDKITKVDGFVLQRGSSSYGSAAAISVGTVLENCIIRNNNGSTYGSAIFIKRHATLASPTVGWNMGAALINCVIVNNTSSSYAAGVFVNQDTHFSINNCVIANNKSTDGTNGVGGLYWGQNVRFSRVANSIFYNNTSTSGITNLRLQVNNQVEAAVFNNYFSDAAFVDADITVANGNKNATDIANPGFANATAFDGYSSDNHDAIVAADWRLKSNSALIGLGSTLAARADIPYPYVATRFAGVARAFTTVSIDVMGSARVINTDVEMGAYEFNPVVVTTVSSDINQGTVSANLTVSKGSMANVEATPGSGYIFENWTDVSGVVSTNMTYSFIAMNDVSLTANFRTDIGTRSKNTNGSKMLLKDRVLTIDNFNGIVTLYQLSGTIYKSSNSNSVNIEKSGVYIIELNNGLDKVYQKLVVK